MSDKRRLEPIQLYRNPMTRPKKGDTFSSFQGAENKATVVRIEHKQVPVVGGQEDVTRVIMTWVGH